MTIHPAIPRFFCWRGFAEPISVTTRHLKLNSQAIIRRLQNRKMIGGGNELMVHNIPDTLGSVIKAARQDAEITVEALAEQVDMTERYLYRIENEGQKPSYDVLLRLIRILNIDPNLIFYPEKETVNSEVEDIARMLYRCNEQSMNIIKATIKAVLDNQK